MVRPSLVLALFLTLSPLSLPSFVQAQDSAAAGEFAKVFTTWNDLLKQLETYQLQYKQAKPADRPAIREQFEKLLKEGESLEPKLRAAAEAAYRAEPNKNNDVSDVLVSLIFADVRREDHDDVLKSAEALIAGKYDNARIYDLGGVAAYQIGELDKAEKYLKEADAKNAISAQGKKFLEDLPDTRKKWEREQKLREAEAKADDLPRVELATNKGRLVIELYENEAPNTVANFISLIEKKYYDGLTFHRVLPGFMAQGGDPQGTGAGGPGYTIECECTQENHRHHFRGTLSMAKTPLPNTGGSQFFITFGRTSNLDGQHTVFGRVIEGLDVLGKLQRRNPEEPNPPTPDKILSAKVLRKRDHKYEPKTLADKG